MAVAATSNPSNLLSALNAPSNVATGAKVDPNQFLTLLTTQLKYQDPMSPANDTQFVGELAQFTTMQQIQQLNASMTNMSNAITQMTAAQSITQAASLLGKTVSYVPANSAISASGVVSSVQVAGGQTQLNVNGAWVPLSQVNGISR